MSVRRPKYGWLRRFFGTKTSPIQSPRRRSSLLSMITLEDRVTPAFAGGVNVAVGDVNGDRFQDIICAKASNGTPDVIVIDGSTGKEYSSFQAYSSSFTGGVYVACGDLNGDGVDEIITGSGNGGGPEVRVFDGKGNLLGSAFPYESTFRGGVIVATADVDGDGRDEVVSGTGVGGGPRVTVANPLTKRMYADYFAYEETFRGGVLVNSADTDGNGKAEIVTGTGVGGGPRVVIFDANTQKVTSNFFAYEDSFRGGVIPGSADVDGDRKFEIVTGTGPGGGPVVSTFTAAGKLLRSITAFDANFRGGVRVASGDLTADGKSEIIASQGPGGTPTVNIFSSDMGQKLYSFSPFDPVSLPNTPISIQNTSNAISSVSGIAPIGLTPSQGVAVTGTNQQLIFRARADGTAVPTDVKLYKADASGNPTDFLLNLYDDGKFTHRDTKSGDTVFTNTFTVNYPAAGSNGYVVKMTGNGVDKTFTTKVSAVTPPSNGTLDLRNNQTSAYQGKLNTLIANGTPVTDALNQIKSQLEADASVIPTSILVTGRGIYWTTVEGLPAGATTLAGSTSERAGGGSGDSSGDTSGSSSTEDDCKGKALVLAPYFYQFEGSTNSDESDDIAQLLRDQGYEVTDKYNKNSGDQNVTIDDFKDFGKYDAVIITAHGDQQTSGSTPIVLTGEQVSITSTLAHLGDILSGRVTTVGDTYALTPAFFDYYSGQLDGSIVYIGACRSAMNGGDDGTATPGFAQTFIDLGAGAYAGYSDYVGSGFAASHGTGIFQHLLNKDAEIQGIPGIGDVETDSDPARFRVFGNDPAAKLTPKCNELQNYNLVFTYTWPTSQKDLDSGTLFLSGSVGYSAPGSPYMTFSGDDTSGGGVEVATIDLYSAFRDGQWSGSVLAYARAGWYIPAEGSGPATVTVSLVNKETGTAKESVQKSINPGAQSGLATTVVGIATITLHGSEGREHVDFEFE